MRHYGSSNLQCVLHHNYGYNYTLYKGVMLCDDSCDFVAQTGHSCNTLSFKIKKLIKHMEMLLLNKEGHSYVLIRIVKKHMLI